MSHTATRPRAAQQRTREDDPPRESWAVLAVALAAQILVVLDISVVNTALPPSGARCASKAASCSGWSPPT